MNAMNESTTPSQRLVSLDTYRGMVMFLMVAEVWHLCRVAAGNPDSAIWASLCHHQSHVPWIGCSLHDLIQPSFTFAVGVALPFSIASRTRRGQSFGFMTAHAAWRAVLLIFLGIFLRSLGHEQTNFTFEDTLTQIGLGYFFLFLLGFRSMRDAWIALALVLVGYWAAFALYPLPPAGFDYETVGVSNDWPHLMTGFAAHWNKNVNLAAGFDRWFMNLFPRESAFAYNGGGYQTLSFIPTLGTMILGLVAGKWLRDANLNETGKLRRLALAGAAGIAAGWLLNALGVCPLVKRIWTPSWTLFSGGWCFLWLAALYLIVDLWSYKRWTFFFVVIGMNSIVIYCMSWLMGDFVVEAFATHLGRDFFLIFGESYQTLVSGTCVIAVFWLILYWMYRNRVFVRI